MDAIKTIHSILLIDDDPDIHQQVENYFVDKEFKLFYAKEAATALKIAQDEQPDVIVCDIILPDQSGLDIFNSLQDNKHTSAIPCILISGEYVQEAGLVGINAQLVKPFTMKDLEKAIRSQMSRARIVEEKFGSTLSVLRTNIAYALPHEMRTPLSHIMGYADLISMDAEDQNMPEIYDHARSIVNATQRLHHTVENYLAYAQLQLIESNPMQRTGLRNTIIKTDMHIEEVTGELALKHNRTNDLKVDVKNTAIRMSSDNLRKIIYEIVDNAMKFSKPETPIFIKTGLKEDRTYIMQIQDFGRGMSTKQIERIGAYMQFDRKIHEQQGAGLGLALVKQLVRLHDGFMQVKSDPDKGTVIRINLPQGD
jgi:signal transduction histidine kinase